MKAGLGHRWVKENQIRKPKLTELTLWDHPTRSFIKEFTVTVMKGFKNAANIWNKGNEWVQFFWDTGDFPSQLRLKKVSVSIKPTAAWLFVVSEENKDQSPTEDCSCTQKGLTTCCSQGCERSRRHQNLVQRSNPLKNFLKMHTFLHMQISEKVEKLEWIWKKKNRINKYYSKLRLNSIWLLMKRSGVLQRCGDFQLKKVKK